MCTFKSWFATGLAALLIVVPDGCVAGSELPGWSAAAPVSFDAGVVATANGLELSSRGATAGTPVASATGSKAVVNSQSLSGLWFNAAQDGHGISLTFQPGSNGTTVGLAWYVYRGGTQYYLVGAGQLVGNRVVAEVSSTSGAQFPPAFRSSDVARVRWGTLTLDVRSCTQISMAWAPSVSGFSPGSVELAPLLVAGGAPCQVTPDGGGGPTDDHGDTCAAASAAIVPGSAAGQINPAADIDMFRFTLGSTSVVGLQSTAGAGLDPIGTLYDANCNPIVEVDDAPTIGLNFRIERTLSAGTYFLGVRSFGAATTGSYQIAFASSSLPPPGNQVVVVVNNALIRPLNVRVNGALIGQAPALSSLTRTVTVSGSLSLDFELVRDQTSQGPIGEAVSGFFNPISSPAGTISFDVNNVIGTTAFFAPLVTNNSGINLQMGVNMGLQAENRCNCVVFPGAGPTRIGYYRLFSNSNVRAYRESTGYSGTYIYCGVDASGTTTPLPQLTEPGTGIVRLTAAFAP